MFFVKKTLDLPTADTALPGRPGAIAIVGMAGGGEKVVGQFAALLPVAETFRDFLLAEAPALLADKPVRKK